MSKGLFCRIGVFISEHLHRNSEFGPNPEKSPETEMKPRCDARIATFNFVEVCNENGEPLTDATVREISKQGAQLRLKSSRKLPERLLLRSPIDRSYNIATLKWISGVSIGVEFDEDVRVPKKRPDPEERIRIVASHFAGNEVSSILRPSSSNSRDMVSNLTIEAKVQEFLLNKAKHNANCC